MSAAPTRSLAPGALALAAAARAVAQVVAQGRSADDALQAAPPKERAAVRAIALGTMRWYLRIAPAVEPLLAQPARSMHPELHALIVCAVHQVEYSRSAAHSAVNIAVDAARVLRQARAAGFVNAVLRRFLRERVALLAAVDAQPAGRHAQPRWFADLCFAAWPAHAEALLAASNEHPPFTLRVDLTRGTRAAYLAELEAAGLPARAVEWLPSAVTLDKAVNVEKLPGFAAGRVSVQDAGAQLAAFLLDAQPGERVLDACAAPGGKSAHLLEHTAGLAALVAADRDAGRLARVAENLTRQGRTAQLLQADVARPNAKAKAALEAGGRFQRILLDAPCSATGVIRRHPDIKLLRRLADIASFATTQLALARACHALLRPGGRLLYCSCSVLPQENEAVVERLLADLPDLTAEALPEALRPPGAVLTTHGMQLLPGAGAGTDGFYYACLTRGSAVR